MIRLPLLTALAALFAVSCGDSTSRVVAEPTPIRIPVPEFSFTERSGKTVTKADLQGKVWVASFVFTRCTGPCPQVTATVSRLTAELADEKDVRFVTFTIDPDRDSLADLKAYAENYRADPERWLFLTGPEQAVHEFANAGFKMLAKKNDAPKPGDEFDHSSKLAVVDKTGTIRGYFDGVKSDKGDPKYAEEQFLTNLALMKQVILTLLKE